MDMNSSLTNLRCDKHGYVGNLTKAVQPATSLVLVLVTLVFQKTAVTLEWDIGIILPGVRILIAIPLWYWMIV